MTKQIPKYMRAGELFSMGASYTNIAAILGIQKNTAKRYVFEYRKRVPIPPRQLGRPKAIQVCEFCGQKLRGKAHGK